LGIGVKNQSRLALASSNRKDLADRAGAKVIRSEVPLSGMFGYSTDLRSATQGRASYSMEFSKYDAVPASVAEELIAKSTGSSAKAAVK
jgi:translation elongation factor EF-G